MRMICNKSLQLCCRGSRQRAWERPTGSGLEVDLARFFEVDRRNGRER